MAQPIRWLHLSDLHFGCRGVELWNEIEAEFFDDVEAHLNRVEWVPDLLLFTGDLTNWGTPEQFDGVDAMLDALGERFRSRGWDPILLPVPGNHDLQRPKKARDYRILQSFDGFTDDPDVKATHDELWNDKDTSFIDPLFAGYRNWFESKVQPELERRSAAFHFSHFPCDYRVDLKPDGTFPLTVVGLNSTWIQYKGGDFDGKLLMPAEQYRAAVTETGGNARKVLEWGKQRLLLMHQPPSWLCDQGKEIFQQEIYPPERFSMCLYGHMHEARSRHVAIGGTAARTLFQSPSLFGLYKYGLKDEDRAFGYAWGEIHENGQIRLWPRKSSVLGSGGRQFVFDAFFQADTQDPLSTVVRPAGFEASPSTPAPSTEDAVRDYLLDLRERVRYIELQSLATDEQTEAMNPTLDRLYTPLYGRDLGSSLSFMGSGKKPLEASLSRSKKILVEGPPGCGKSTFLRRVVSILVREALGEPIPTGCEGLRALKVDIPVLLPLEGLARETLGDGPVDRERLLDLLAKDCSAKNLSFDRPTWRRLFEEGRAGLFLDGMDEVADPELRQNVLTVLQDAAEHWPVRWVLASRPFLTDGLRRAGFSQLQVEPLDLGDVRRFLAQWVAMLYEEKKGIAERGASGDYLPKLESAMVRGDLRRLASNPMMLTCLCIVHWVRGELPKGRAKIYEAVLKWLLEVKGEARRKRFGLEDSEALEALSELALDAMGPGREKRVLLDLKDSVAVVLPFFERAHPELDEDGRLLKAREWLLFEAGESGILEDLPGDRLRFWHLTFQEYLAALRLAKPRVGEDWWPVLEPHLDDAQWRETVELFASCLKLYNDLSHTDRLLSRVLALASGGRNLTADAKVTAILGRILPALEVYGYRPEASTVEMQSQLKERVMRIFEESGASEVPVEQRIEAAEALGRGGDPRLAMESFEECQLEVPGTGIRLGKYPVTVEEFHRFVEARGYEERQWWSVEGWKVREESSWTEPGSWTDQLQTPNRPVTRVSWYEAEAYCRWLSSLHAKWSIRLPKESEWQAAAEAEKGEYPWGESSPMPDLANFDGNVGAASPVGVYPMGAGRLGHLDLGGNAWEWCLDDLGEVRPLRGGAWSHSASALRSAIRYRYVPVLRFVYVGFRVSCAPSKS